jgi:hypothetical protein
LKSIVFPLGQRSTFIGGLDLHNLTLFGDRVDMVGGRQNLNRILCGSQGLASGTRMNSILSVATTSQSPHIFLDSIGTYFGALRRGSQFCFDPTNALCGPPTSKDARPTPRQDQSNKSTAYETDAC